MKRRTLPAALAIPNKLADDVRQLCGGLSKEQRLEVLRAALEQAGISQAVIDGLVERAEIMAGKEIDLHVDNDKDVVHELRTKRALALRFIDPFVIAQTSAKDLAIVTGILSEKIEMLESKTPMRTLSNKDRDHLDKLIPELVEEAKRRGTTLDLPKDSYVTED